MNAQACRCMRLVLGDQLNREHSWFSHVHNDVVYVFAELRQETDYVRHHAQKVVAFFAAMKAFSDELESAGHRTLYLDLDHTQDDVDLPALLQRLFTEWGVSRFEYLLPDEYRLRRQLAEFSEKLDMETAALDTEHFLLPFDVLGEWFDAGKKTRMEHFYRRMRRHLDILIDDQGQPVGERWNFDTENRKKLPSSQSIPPVLRLNNPTEPIRARIERHGIQTIGNFQDDLQWPVNASQARRVMNHFIEHCLPDFGRFQDALSTRDPWLFHSRLSFALNAKILSPRELVDSVMAAWQRDRQRYPLASIEGFIRQVIGWREFMRGIYWTYMPGYATRNHLGSKRKLPRFFWDGKTDMACMAHAIGQSLDHAYAHHIQRLMVTGNFALLAGIDPDEVDAWYLGIYIDAVEWVEMPNTRGMSQFADGGVIASKPYCSSGNYINKMSDYCAQCSYRVKDKTGQQACPFNSLYWHFMIRHRDELSRNPRIGMIYRSWDRMNEEHRDGVLKTAEAILDQLDDL